MSSALVLSALPTATPATAGGRIVVGADGDHADLQRAIGMPLGTHVFGKLSGPARIGTLTNIQSTIPWRSVAGAGPGSGPYNDMVRWANAVKAAGRPVLVTFHHEPETHFSDRYGSSGDFVRAWRKIHDIFASRGARNAEWVWNLSANSFKVSPGDHRYAAKWYPGASYVDSVGADPYNWVNCGPGQGGWRMMGDIIGPALNWARAHGKQMVLPEFASNVDPNNAARKAQWLADAHNYFVRNKSVFRGVFYYNNLDRGCHWKIDKPGEIAAFRAMVRDSSFSSGL